MNNKTVLFVGDEKIGEVTDFTLTHNIEEMEEKMYAVSGISPDKLMAKHTVSGSCEIHLSRINMWKIRFWLWWQKLRSRYDRCKINCK